MARLNTKLMVDIAISTISRSHDYVHKVVTSLPMKRRLRLVVGSPNYQYLERYRGNPFVEIVGVDPMEWDYIKDFSVQQRASWNYWRCLTHGVGASPQKGLLVLEDDVLPAPSWEDKFALTVSQIECEYGDEYVLSLYTCYTELPKVDYPGQLFKGYPAKRFCGTQAMYFTDATRAAFADYLRAEGVETYRRPYDILLNEYVRLTGIALFATTPCLFEHIGEVSTGLCGGFHRAGAL